MPLANRWSHPTGERHQGVFGESACGRLACRSNDLSGSWSGWMRPVPTLGWAIGWATGPDQALTEDSNIHRITAGSTTSLHEVSGTLEAGRQQSRYCMGARWDSSTRRRSGPQRRPSVMCCALPGLLPDSRRHRLGRCSACPNRSSPNGSPGPGPHRSTDSRRSTLPIYLRRVWATSSTVPGCSRRYRPAPSGYSIRTKVAFGCGCSGSVKVQRSGTGGARGTSTSLSRREPSRPGSW